jgi:hypothetical protein
MHAKNPGQSIITEGEERKIRFHRIVKCVKLNELHEVVQMNAGNKTKAVQKKSNKQHRFYSFIRPFIEFAIAKLDFAMICRDSLVTSGKACTSLSLLACSLSSRRTSLP